MINAAVKSQPTANHPFDVSVCIANYNGNLILQDCLNSIYEQATSLSIEIIVHDDASIDNSREILERNHHALTAIYSNRNVGFCTSNNRMVAEAKGRYILLLNNDAALMPDAIQTLFEAAQLKGDCVLTLPQHDAATGQFIDCGHYMDFFCNAVPIEKLQEQESAFVIGACLWSSKSLWDELGGFPEWFGSLGEDAFFCSLARLRSHAIIALAQSGYYHHVGHSFGGGKVVSNALKTSSKRRKYSERNKAYLMAVCYPGYSPLLLLPLHFFLLLLEGLTLSLIKRNFSIFSEIYLFTFTEFIKNWRSLLRIRGDVQRARTCSISSFFSPFRIVPQKLYLLIKHGLPTITPQSK